MYQYRETFNACYDDCGSVVGECGPFANQPFTVVRVIDAPDETHDAESIPMFVIRCNGNEFEAWPEEVLADEQIES